MANLLTKAETRAQFCFFPGVQGWKAERRAAELIAEAVQAEGHRAALPQKRMQGSAPRLVLSSEVVLPMIDRGMSLNDVAAALGVSPFTLKDRLRMWRPMRRRHAPGAEPIMTIVARVAAETGVAVGDILGARRGVNVIARARIRVMVLAADAGHHPSVIAEALKRDRTTVLQNIAAARARAERA